MPGGAQRDPLSLEYDARVHVILAAIAQRKTWPREGVLVRTWIELPLVDLPDNVPGSTMTRNERAFVRSLYFHLKRMRPARSIARPQWGERNLVTSKRMVSFRVFTGSSAARHWRESPEDQRFTHNPDLRSPGGIR